MDATTLRRQLHAHPGTAWKEHAAVSILEEALEAESLRPIARPAGGLLYRIGEGKPVRLLRADLDALPHGHRCGHDGHMAMLAAALPGMEPKGTVLALFQPAEETGEGMLRCLEDPALEDVDQVFAIHNVPGATRGAVILGPGALASTGIRVTLKGKTAHASVPEAPGDVYAPLTELANDMRRRGTLVALHYGNEDYGIRPGSGRAAATVRGTQAHLDACYEAWSAQGDADRVEPFPETRNDAACVELVRQAAASIGIPTIVRKEPFAWSEDFGHATSRWPGALLGLGAGDVPDLHDPNYVFPDALLATGIKLWRAIASS